MKRFGALPAADRPTAIVRFVQDDVRYVGVEIGEHSHRPHSPSWVLERGFGDCKDKTLLLVSLLRAAGIDAAPALVYSGRTLKLRSSLPSAFAFNHAIAHVRVDGNEYFIDPTMTLRRGSLASMASQDVVDALIVRAESTDLAHPPPSPPSQPSWDVLQTWTHAPENAAELTIEITARAEHAATLRHVVMELPRQELVEDRRKQRVETFERELTAKGIEWTDDEARDVVVLRERYEVPRAFAEDLQLHALSIGGDLRRVEQTRRHPLALDHPSHVRERIVYVSDSALDPEEFTLENRTVASAGFELEVRQEVTGRKLTLEWEYTTTKDRVLADELATHRSAVESAWDTLSYVVQPPRAIASRHGGDYSGFGWICSSLVAIAIVLMVMRVLGREPTPEKPSLRARFRAWRFRKRQAATPGELATSPLTLRSVDEAKRHFRSRVCPVGHAWQPSLAVAESVRVGDERVSVIERRCSGCDARERRYAKLLS